MSIEELEKPKTKKVLSVLSFGIEAAHPRNCDLFIQVLGVRLRSEINPVKQIFDRQDGEQITRPTSAKLIDGLPNILPGMQLLVKPGELTYKTVDPISDDTLDRVVRAMKVSSEVSVQSKLRGVKPQEGKVDKDQMKTLVREMYNLVQAGEARVCKGKLPEMADIEDLPGEFLTNSRNLGNWKQPRYEKDVPAWVEKLNSIE